jgi:hypothetical protein
MPHRKDKQRRLQAISAVYLNKPQLLQHSYLRQISSLFKRHRCALPSRIEACLQRTSRDKLFSQTARVEQTPSLFPRQSPVPPPPRHTVTHLHRGQSRSPTLNALPRQKRIFDRKPTAFVSYPPPTQAHPIQPTQPTQARRQEL